MPLIVLNGPLNSKSTNLMEPSCHFEGEIAPDKVNGYMSKPAEEKFGQVKTDWLNMTLVVLTKLLNTKSTSQ